MCNRLSGIHRPLIIYLEDLVTGILLQHCKKIYEIMTVTVIVTNNNKKEIENSGPHGPPLDKG